MKNLLLLMSLLMITAISCNKDEDSDSDSNTDLISSAKWYMDEAGTFDACEVDDYFKLEASLTMKVVVGDVPCASDIFTELPGTWKFADDEKTLIQNLLFFMDTSTVQTLNATTLELVDNNGKVFKFKH